jgi:hypothetical protein
LPARSASGASPGNTSKTAEQAVDRVLAARDWRQILPAAAASFSESRGQVSAASDPVFFDTQGRPVRQAAENYWWKGT